MPIAGTRQKRVGGNYEMDPMYSYAQSFANCQRNILAESAIDVYDEPRKAYRMEGTKEALRNFFVENSYDPSDPMMQNPSALQDHLQSMNEQFENDVEAMNEHAAPAEYNPAIGMTLPIHKNILMNMVFDKGAIQKTTAVYPKFTETMEVRLLVTPDGREIDMFLEQNEMTAAIDATVPIVNFDVTLPNIGATDYVAALGGGQQDSLDIVETYINAVKVEGVYIAEGEVLPNEDGYLEGEIATADTAGTYDVWYRTAIRMEPNFGGKERAVIQPIAITYKTDANGTTAELKGCISASLDHNVVEIADMYGAIKTVRLQARLDTSNAMTTTCSTSWKAISQLIEIGTSIPINTTISPEEIKDIALLYDVNQLTKYMSLFKTTLANYKDDKIKQNLEKSWNTMPARSKAEITYDFEPRQDYALDHIEWRHKTFMDKLDRLVSKMLQVLNDPNMTVTVFGDPDTIRRIGPTSYEYKTPDSIGQVELDYTKGVITSDKRTYQFIGSDKMRGRQDLIVILCPHNSQRIVYRIYDYQMYVSNEIRNINNPALPAIHAFERWRFFEYQPVQGKVHLLNNGLEDL
jgi:hypothetical protein